MPDDRLSFKQGVQFAWDSTSLRTFQECPRKYQLSILRGFAPRSESVHLTFGIHYHKGLELYDHYRALGQTHDNAVCDMVAYMMAATKGWVSDHSGKNRFTLIRSLVWYCEEFRNDAAQTIILANGKPAVELSFSFSLMEDAPSGETYLYCGHLDRLVEYQDAHYVLDRKSTGSTISQGFFDKFTPNTQMSGYTAGGRIALATPVKGVIIDAVQCAVGFNRYARGFANRTDFQIDEFLEEATWWIKLAEGYSSTDFWPKNENSCDNYGGCPFRPICAKGTPRLRELWLQQDYTRRMWDPLAIRGDI